MSHRKVVYHKDYKRHGTEEERSRLSKVVSSDEELKALGKDWGDHPESKAPKSEPKAEPESTKGKGK